MTGTLPPVPPGYRMKKRHERPGTGGYFETFFAEDGSKYQRRISADGTVAVKEWWHDEHGHPHRDGGLPARVTRTGTGELREEEWYVGGCLSRLDGPAKITYNADGSTSGVWIVGGTYTDPEALRYTLSNIRGWVLALEVRASVFAPLLDEGMEVAEVIEALSAEVFTLEGIRALRAGAPAEWVRSFEEGAAS